jgi:hypothetical protein
VIAIVLITTGVIGLFIVSAGTRAIRCRPCQRASVGCRPRWFTPDLAPASRSTDNWVMVVTSL